MPISFRLERDISAPPDGVFATLTDLDAAGQWMPSFVRIERLDQGPLRVGSEWRETRKMFGREATEQFEVTELDPPRRLALRVDGTKGASKKGEYVFVYDLTPTERGTHLVMDGSIQGLSRVADFFGRLFAGMFKKLCAKDFDAMANYIERQTTTAPAV